MFFNEKRSPFQDLTVLTHHRQRSNHRRGKGRAPVSREGVGRGPNVAGGGIQGEGGPGLGKERGKGEG